MKNKLILTLNNSLKYGALMGVVFILLSLIYYIAGFDQFNTVFGIVNLLISLAMYIGFLYYSNKILRDKKLNGILTYTDGLLNSFFTGVIAAIVGILMYFTNILIHPILQKLLNAVSRCWNRILP